MTVFKNLKEIMPDENYIYFGDTKNMPYGEKTEAQLLEYACNIFDFFISKGAKAVVMACNTTSAVVYDKLKKLYPSLRIYPIIQSVAGILAQLPVKKIGVLATPATVNSHAYKKGIKKLKPSIEVVEIACPDWVKIVEGAGIGLNDLSSTDEGHIKVHELASIKEKAYEVLSHYPGKIVLGCTHYPYLLPLIVQFAPKDLFIDPAESFAKFIKEQESKHSTRRTKDKNPTTKFYVSASPENFVSAGKMFCEIEELPELLNPHDLPVE